MATKLRLPVKRVRKDKYYFMIFYNSRMSKKALDPTNFDLIRVVSILDISYATYHCLNSFCVRNREEPQVASVRSFNFYLATQKEVAAAKERQKQLEYQRIDSLIDEF